MTPDPLASAQSAPRGSAPPSPLVTVVMACYEAGDTFPAAVASVLAQTVWDIEVLALDDGSRSRGIPADLGDDPRLRIHRFPDNRGYAAITNDALRMARGCWVTFVDSDDTVPEDYLATLLAAAEETGADNVFAPVMCVRDGIEIGTQWWRPPGHTADSRDAMRAILRHDIPGHQQVLMRRPTVEAPEGHPYSDFVFQLRNLAAQGRVAYVDRPMYRYTIHSASVSGGLHENVWSLRDLPPLVEDLIREVFDEDEAASLIRDLERHVLTQMLHKAAREARPTALRRDVTAHCRSRVSLRGALDLARRGHRSEAVEWMLLRISPALHRAAYQSFDRRKARLAGM